MTGDRPRGRKTTAELFSPLSLEQRQTALKSLVKVNEKLTAYRCRTREGQPVTQEYNRGMAALALMFATLAVLTYLTALI